MALEELEQRNTSRTIAWLEDHTGFSDQDVGDLFGVKRRTIINWKTGENPPHKNNQAMVSKLQQFRFLADEIFENDEQFEDWLLQPSSELDGQPPREALREGNLESLLDILSTYYNGAFV